MQIKFFNYSSNHFSKMFFTNGIIILILLCHRTFTTMDTKNSFFRILLYSLLILLFLILFIYGLIQARHVLQPLVLGILLSYLFAPVSNRFIKIGIPFWLSNLVSALILAGIMILAFILIFNEVQNISENVLIYKEKALINIDKLALLIQENFGISPFDQKRIMKENIHEMLDSSSQFMKGIYRGIFNTMAKLLLLPVFVFYLLQMRKRINTFILLSTPSDKRHHTKMIFRKVTLMIEKYVTGVFSVIAVLMVLNSLGLWIVGMKYPFVFGILSAILNLIPYFGNWAGGLIAIVFTLLVDDNPEKAMYILLLYAIIQFVEHNILTPNITGTYVKLNQIVTIIALIAGGMIWGLAGMLVVIPFMAALKIVLEQFDITRPYAYILGTDDHPLTISKIRKIFTPKRPK